MCVIYASQLKLWLRSNPVSNSFLLRKCAIDHGPQTQKQGPNEDLKKKQGRIMLILQLQYDYDAKNAVPETY